MNRMAWLQAKLGRATRQDDAQRLGRRIVHGEGGKYGDDMIRTS